MVVDDLASVDPWTPRSIEIRGRAVAHTVARTIVSTSMANTVKPVASG